jgi:hypothetical protein
MIYFVKANDRIKIGYADDPSDRISQLQTANSYDLEVLLIIEGNYDKESELHKQFGKFRVAGEWFRFEEPIIEYIRENLIYDRKYEFGFNINDFSGNEQLSRLRTKHRLTLQAIGNILGITSVSVREILDREKSGSITIKLMNKVGDALGYKFEYRFVPKINKKEEKRENNQPID